jgi:hypothetical protein
MHCSRRLLLAGLCCVVLALGCAKGENADREPVQNPNKLQKGIQFMGGKPAPSLPGHNPDGEK